MCRHVVARTMLGVLAAVVAFTHMLAARTPATDPSAGANAPTSRSDGAAYEDYVALGDSYTAGPLIPLIRLDPLGCMRSTSNYPAFLAAYLDVSSYTDVSCSGAQTRHLRQPQVTFAGANPPQLAPLDKETDLVTLGIGGNDFGLFGDLTSRCPRVRSQDPTGAPCKAKFTVDGVDTKMRDARRIKDHVARAVRGIRRRSPDATVVVVGYPRIVPPHGTCTDVVSFADGDYRWANRVERFLNRSLRHAATRNGARYAGVYATSFGHDACKGPKAWVNGQQIKPEQAFAYHPLRRGMQGVAREIFGQLTGKPAPHLAPRTTDAPTMPEAQQRRLADQVAGAHR